jgi:hypothetical protein
MEFTTHQCHGKTISEARGDGDALELMVGSGARRLVVHAPQLHPDFFDLSTRLAGEVLQKFTNYHVQLGIVGDCLPDFIRESNRGTQVVFAASLQEALERLARD